LLWIFNTNWMSLFWGETVEDWAQGSCSHENLPKQKKADRGCCTAKSCNNLSVYRNSCSRENQNQVRLNPECVQNDIPYQKILGLQDIKPAEKECSRPIFIQLLIGWADEVNRHWHDIRGLVDVSDTCSRCLPDISAMQQTSAIKAAGVRIYLSWLCTGETTARYICPHNRCAWLWRGGGR
jgi:hypothetical protein